MGCLFVALSAHSVLQTLASWALQTLSSLFLIHRVGQVPPGFFLTVPWPAISLKAVNLGSCRTHLVCYYPSFPNIQCLENCYMFCLFYFFGCFRQEGKSGPWTLSWAEAGVLLNPNALPLFKKNFVWSIVDFQCCVSFRCTAEWISYKYTYIHSFIFFRFFSHIDHYRALSRVPYAIQLVLISYIFYIQSCVYVSPNLPMCCHF